MKTLLNSLENANKWITKIEIKLSNPENVLENSNLSQLSLNIQRIVNELNVIFIIIINIQTKLNRSNLGDTKFIEK